MYKIGSLVILSSVFLILLISANPVESSHFTSTTCPKPYHVITSDDRCVWSCSTGTTPDSASNECVCKPGYTQTGTDSFGRRTCSNTITSPSPTQTTTTNMLTVAISTSGGLSGGRVTGSGINCPGTCYSSYSSTSSVTLTETPNSGFVFTGWSGACSGTISTCTVSMGSAKSVTAVFSPQTTTSPSPTTSTSPTSAMLSVSSTPSGATVTNINTGYVYCQSTPCNVQVAVPPNSVNIKVSKTGYSNWTNLIYLYSGQTTNVNAALLASTSPSTTPSPTTTSCNSQGLYYGCNNPPYTTEQSCLNVALTNYQSQYPNALSNCCTQASWGWNCYLNPNNQSTTSPSPTTTTAYQPPSLSCSTDSECSWLITNGCPETAGANWQCSSLLQPLPTYISTACPDAISLKPSLNCGCIQNSCVPYQLGEPKEPPRKIGQTNFDTTKLLTIVIQMEQLKVKFDFLKSATAKLSLYYNATSNSDSFNKWLKATEMLEDGIDKIEQLKEQVRNKIDTFGIEDLRELKKEIKSLIGIIKEIVKIILAPSATTPTSPPGSPRSPGTETNQTNQTNLTESSEITANFNLNLISGNNTDVEFLVLGRQSTITQLQFDISYNPSLLRLNNQFGSLPGVTRGRDLGSGMVVTVISPTSTRARIQIQNPANRTIVEQGYDKELVKIRFQSLGNFSLGADISVLNVFAEDASGNPVNALFNI